MATFKTILGVVALTSGLSLAKVATVGQVIDLPAAGAPSPLGVGDGFSRVGRVIDLPAPLGATEVTEDTEFGGEVVDLLAAPSLPGVGDGPSPVDGAAGSRAIWYVDDDAPPGGDGASWDAAFKYLQDALAVRYAVDVWAHARYAPDMPRKASQPKAASPAAIPAGRPSALVDTRIIYCGDCLDQLPKLPDGCVDLIYIDPPFNSNRNYEVFWGERSEPRAQASGFPARFEDRHASTAAYIDYMRPRCVELARVNQSRNAMYDREF